MPKTKGKKAPAPVVAAGGIRRNRLPRNGRATVTVPKFITKIAPQLARELEILGKGTRKVTTQEFIAGFKKLQRIAGEMDDDLYDSAGKLKAFKTLKTDQDRAKMIRQELDQLRAQQRVRLTHELAKLQHGCLAKDLSRFAGVSRSWLAGPALTCTPGSQEEVLRRFELLVACQRSMGLDWPKEVAIDIEAGVAGPLAVQRCAYEAILALSGADSFRQYWRKTSELRAAMGEVFDLAEPGSGNWDPRLCDSMDTAMLCIDHTNMRKFNMVSCYTLADYHSEPFIGALKRDRGLIKLVYGRHGPAYTDMPKHEWGWGDIRGRIARGRLLRVIEEILLQIPKLNWAAVQESYAAILFADDYFEPGRTVIGGDGKTQRLPLTGANLMELFDGEMAAEFNAMLYRMLHAGDENRERIDEILDDDEEMPTLPAYVGPSNTETYASVFTYEEEDGAEEMARSYVQRLMYTAYASSWFLRSPACPAALCSLERACSLKWSEVLEWSALPQGMFDVMYDSFDEELGQSDAEQAARILWTHRDFGLRLGDGRSEAQTANARRIMLDAAGASIGDGGYKQPCGQDYNAQAIAAVSLVTMWDRKIILLAGGIICTLVLAPESGAAYALYTIGGFSKYLLMQTYAGLDAIMNHPGISGATGRVAKWAVPAFTRLFGRTILAPVPGGQAASEALAKGIEIVVAADAASEAFENKVVGFVEGAATGVFRAVFGGGAGDVAGAALGAAPSGDIAAVFSVGADGSQIIDGVGITVIDLSSGDYGYVGQTYDPAVAPPGLADIATWPMVGQPASSTTPPPPPPQAAIDVLRATDALTLLAAMAAAEGTANDPPLADDSPVSKVGSHVADINGFSAVGYATLLERQAQVPVNSTNEYEVKNISALGKRELRMLFGGDQATKRQILMRMDTELYRAGATARVDGPVTRLQSGATQSRSYVAASAIDVLDIVAPLASTSFSYRPLVARKAEPMLFPIPESQIA